MRSNATRVLAQGVGALPRKAFGGGTYGSDLRVWDAKLPMHLPLPRAVGPYTIIRTTRRVNLGTKVAIVGCYQHAGTGHWTDVCVKTDATATNPIGGVNNTYSFMHAMDGLGSAATVCPAAISVQLMNPQPLQTTSGIIYMGTMNTQAKLGGRSETWDSYANKFVQFQNPRLVSAGRLALKGIQIDSYPLNMGAISDFTPIHHHTGAQPGTWDATNDEEPTGWAPIIIYNANAPEGPPLEYLITTEWRVRFDLDNPAAAGHTQHPTASDSLWDRLTRTASSRGHNARDIGETISDTGSFHHMASSASSAMSTMRTLARAVSTAEDLLA